MATATARYFPPDSRERIAQAQRRRWSDQKRSSEHVIQSTIARHLEMRKQPGVFWFAVPNGGKRDPVTGRVMKAEGVRPGVPDLGLIIKGQPYFLEVKKENGKLSQAQRELRVEIEAAGAVWAVAKGLDAALQQLVDWGALKPAGQIA